jgi:hypothetical protein
MSLFSRAGLPAIAALFATWLATSSPAAVLNITNAATYSDSGPCTDPGAGGTCYTSSYLGTATVNGGDYINDSTSYVGAGISYPGGSLFGQAFAAWNATGGGQGWSLFDGTADGVDDLGGTMSVTTFTTEAFDDDPYLGGLTIRVNPNGLTLANGDPLPALPAGEAYVWAQGLYDNYLLDGATVAPFFEMDIADATGGDCQTNGNGGNGGDPACAPAYPFQNSAGNANLFYDQPGANLGQFFAAEAFFSVIDYTNKSLTIYDGVDYGFVNYAPEPGTWTLCLAALGAVVFKRCRKVKAPKC